MSDEFMSFFEIVVKVVKLYFITVIPNVTRIQSQNYDLVIFLLKKSTFKRV